MKIAHRSYTDKYPLLKISNSLDVCKKKIFAITQFQLEMQVQIMYLEYFFFLSFFLSDPVSRDEMQCKQIAAGKKKQ